MHVCPSKKSIKKRHAKAFLSVIKNRFNLDFVLFVQEPLSQGFIYFTALVCIFWTL